MGSITETRKVTPYDAFHANHQEYAILNYREAYASNQLADYTAP